MIDDIKMILNDKVVVGWVLWAMLCETYLSYNDDINYICYI